MLLKNELTAPDHRAACGSQLGIEIANLALQSSECLGVQIGDRTTEAIYGGLHDPLTVCELVGLSVGNRRTLSSLRRAAARRKSWGSGCRRRADPQRRGRPPGLAPLVSRPPLRRVFGRYWTDLAIDSLRPNRPVGVSLHRPAALTPCPEYLGIEPPDPGLPDAG
jgi:hypothetical protein